jgi:hypothetical protein
VALVVLQMWLPWLTYNRNNNTNSLCSTFNCRSQGEANRVMRNGTILTTVTESSRFASISFTPSA